MPLSKRVAVWLQAVPVVVTLALTFWLGQRCASPEAEHSGHDHAAADSAQAQIWTCSMHPQIQLPEPGACPICGMDLIPLTPQDSQASPDQIRLSEAARTLAKIRTTPVRRQDVSTELRLLGRLEYDETRLRSVTSWVSGRIDRLYVSSVGAKVGKGSRLAQVYSPEVFAAHQDLISAKKQLGAMKDALPIARSATESMLKAARNRLRLLGLNEALVAEMEKEESPRQHVVIHAPFGGTVVEQLVHQGAYVATGTALFSVAGLSRLWVQLDAYETDLARIQVGSTVTLAVSSFPDREFSGTVTFVDPVVDAATRTARVRVEVDNADGELRPGMFADAVIHSDDEAERAPLVIPRTAPLFTGVRSVVYVESQGEDGPVYSPREVQLAPLAGDVYPVVAGLEEGEQIVAQGAFALDSELQIRGGNSMMARDDDLARQSQAAIELTPDAKQSLAPLFEQYLKLQQALSQDDIQTGKQLFQTMEKQVGQVQIKHPQEAVRLWKEAAPKLSQAAADGSAALGAKDASVLSTGKALSALSEQMIVLSHRFGNPLPERLRVARCPMALGGEGGSWLQRAERVENPYYGSKMYRCGDILEELAEEGPATEADGSQKATPKKQKQKSSSRAPAPKPAAPKPPAAPGHDGHNH